MWSRNIYDTVFFPVVRDVYDIAYFYYLIFATLLIFTNFHVCMKRTCTLQLLKSGFCINALDKGLIRAL